MDTSDVEYKNTPLDIFNFNKSELENLIITIFKTKTEKWNYEKEIRLINKEQGLLKINTKCIKQIIFGCRTSPKDKYSILKLLACLGYKVEELMVAKIQPDSYELKIETMTIANIAGSGVLIEELNIKDKP